MPRLWSIRRTTSRMESQGPLELMEAIRSETRRYFHALIRTHGRIPDPQIRLTSIHGSKGRQADHVVLIPDMTRTTFREYRRGRRGSREEENRVFYVGVTRARKSVTLARPRRQRTYDLPRLSEVARG